MGIGINFVCSCCNYDSGILMIAQGDSHPIHSVIDKFLYTCVNEIDPEVVGSRLDLYKMVRLYLSSHPEKESTYYYHACVCYGCNRTYELLDVYQRVEEGVFVATKRRGGESSSIVQNVFEVSNAQWSSLIGDDLQCLFCDQIMKKVTEEALHSGVHCPKCSHGLLQLGNDFEIWD